MIFFIYFYFFHDTIYTRVDNNNNDFYFTQTEFRMNFAHVVIQ